MNQLPQGILHLVVLLAIPLLALAFLLGGPIASILLLLLILGGLWAYIKNNKKAE